MLYRYLVARKVPHDTGPIYTSTYKGYTDILDLAGSTLATRSTETPGVNSSYAANFYTLDANGDMTGAVSSISWPKVLESATATDSYEPYQEWKLSPGEDKFVGGIFRRSLGANPFGKPNRRESNGIRMYCKISGTWAGAVGGTASSLYGSTYDSYPDSTSWRDNTTAAHLMVAWDGVGTTSKNLVALDVIIRKYVTSPTTGWTWNTSSDVRVQLQAPVLVSNFDYERPANCVWVSDSLLVVITFANSSGFKYTTISYNGSTATVLASGVMGSHAASIRSLAHRGSCKTAGDNRFFFWAQPLTTTATPSFSDGSNKYVWDYSVNPTTGVLTENLIPGIKNQTGSATTSSTYMQDFVFPSDSTNLRGVGLSREAGGVTYGYPINADGFGNYAASEVPYVFPTTSSSGYMKMAGHASGTIWMANMTGGAGGDALYGSIRSAKL